ncbi:MAG: HU family DNA-binding protein [Prevotella sp.]
MAVFYRLYQNNNEKVGQYKMWYARAVAINKVTTNDLAKTIEANCTVKRADILAVLSELVVAMTNELQDSKRVVLDGLGSFKLAINSIPSVSAKDFNAGSNVKKVRVIFSPEAHIDSTGRYIKTFLDGCKVAELPKNDVSKSE